MSLRRRRFSLLLSLLMPASALQSTPPLLPVWLLCGLNAPLPDQTAINGRSKSAASLPHSKHTPLRSLQRVGRLVGPRALAVLYRTWSTWEAVPQYISGRTSYLQVRLAFHSYTQLIRDCFSRHRFGPPLPFTGVSTWSCVAHLVSSLAQRTRVALFGLAFAPPPSH